MMFFLRDVSATETVMVSGLFREGGVICLSGTGHVTLPGNHQWKECLNEGMLWHGLLGLDDVLQNDGMIELQKRQLTKSVELPFTPLGSCDLLVFVSMPHTKGCPRHSACLVDAACRFNFFSARFEQVAIHSLIMDSRVQRWASAPYEEFPPLGLYNVFSTVEFISKKCTAVGSNSRDFPIDTFLADLAGLAARWCSSLSADEFSTMCRDIVALSQLDSRVAFPALAPDVCLSHLRDKGFWLSLFHACFINGLPIGCSLLGSAKFKSLSNATGATENVLHGRGKQQVLGEHLLGKPLAIVRAIDSAFASTHAFDRCVGQAAAAADHAVDGLFGFLKERSHSWKITVPTTVALAFSRHIQCGSLDGCYLSSLTTANRKEGDLRTQDTARLFPSSTLSIALPNSCAVQVNFLLGGARNCALLQDQVPTHCAAALRDLTATESDFHPLVGGQVLRARFFCHPGDSTSPLHAVVSNAGKLHETRPWFHNGQEGQRSALEAFRRCVGQGIDFLSRTNKGALSDLRTTFGLDLWDKSSNGASVPFYSGPSLDQDQLEEIAFVPLQQSGPGIGLLSSWQHVISFWWGNIRINIATSDVDAESVQWTDQEGGHIVPLSELPASPTGAHNVQSISVRCGASSVMSALQTTQHLWVCTKQADHVRWVLETIGCAAGLVRSCFQPQDTDQTCPNELSSMLANALQSLRVALTVARSKATIDLESCIQSIAIPIIRLPSFGVLTLPDGQTRRVPLVEEGDIDSPYSGGRRATCVLTLAGSSVTAQLLPPHELVRHTLVSTSVLKLSADRCEQSRNNLDLLQAVFGLVDTNDQAYRLRYIHERQPGDPIVSDFGCLFQAVRHKWSAISRYTTVFENYAKGIREHCTAFSYCSPVICEISMAIVFLELADTAEDYPPLLVVAMLRAACRCAELHQVTEHFHSIPFPRTCNLEALADMKKTVFLLVRKWNLRPPVKQLWSARLMLVAVDQVLSRAKSPRELTDADLWSDIFSSVHGLSFATGPNWAHCTVTVAVQALALSYPNCDCVSENMIINWGTFAVSWLIALQLGVTPLLAFWIALANQHLHLNGSSFRDVLLHYLSSHPRQLLYFIDEISLRTRVGSKAWAESHLRLVVTRRGSIPLQAFIVSMGDALNFDLRIRTPVHFDPGRTAYEHVWSSACWDNLRNNSLWSTIGTLTCSDTVATSIWLSGVMHRAIAQESKGDPAVLSKTTFARIQTYARALNRFPCRSICPSRYGHPAYRQFKRAIRRLIPKLPSQVIGDLSFILGWHNGGSAQLHPSEMVCCGFRDSADCLELALPRAGGTRPSAQVTREGASLTCHPHPPWTMDSEFESEAEWDKNEDQFARTLAHEWLREHTHDAYVMLPDLRDLFLGPLAKHTGFVPRGPTRAIPTCTEHAESSSATILRPRSRPPPQSVYRITGKLSLASPDGSYLDS